MLGPTVDYGVRRVELALQCRPVKRMSAPHASTESKCISAVRVDNGPVWLHEAQSKSEEPGPSLATSTGEKQAFIFQVTSAPQVLRNIQLVVDNWLTGDRIELSDQLQTVLSPQGFADARCGRTALLSAAHAGVEDAALMLARRGAVLRCEVTNENNPSEELSAVMVTVTAELHQQFKESGLPAPPPLPTEGEFSLIVPVNTDINNLDAVDGHAVEALRVAAYRGMGAVVHSLLQCREQLGSTVGVRLGQPLLTEQERDKPRDEPASTLRRSHSLARISSVLFSDASKQDTQWTFRGVPPPADGLGRTALHDVCRSVLPNPSGFQFEQQHKHLLAYAEALLAEDGLHGVALFASDIKGRLPLHYAAAFGHYMLLELLLSHNLEATLEHTDKSSRGIEPWFTLRSFRHATGHTPGDHADFDELDKLEKVEEVGGWLVNLRDKQGWSPLALAVGNGHLHCAKLLLDSGAEPVPLPLMKDYKVPCAYLLVLHRLGWEQMVRKESTKDGYRFGDLGQDTLKPSDPAKKEHRHPRAANPPASTSGIRDRNLKKKPVAPKESTAGGVAPASAPNQIKARLRGGRGSVAVRPDLVDGMKSWWPDLVPSAFSSMDARGEDDEANLGAVEGKKRGGRGSDAARPDGDLDEGGHDQASADLEESNMLGAMPRMVYQMWVRKPARLIKESDKRTNENLKVPESQRLAKALMAPLVDVDHQDCASTHRFRRFFLVSRQLPSIIYYLVFLALLTMVAFTTAGVDGSLRFGSRRKGVSLPFILTSEVGGLVPKEEFQEEATSPQFTFLDADEPEVLIQFLQGYVANA